MIKNNLLKTTSIIIIAASLFSCNNLRKDKNAIDSDKIIGKYEVDLSPLAANFTEEDNPLVRLALSSFRVHVSFYDNNKGVLELNGKAIDLASIIIKEPIEKLHEFNYKIEDDSVFYLKFKEHEEYKKRAIIRKLGDNYDYLQFMAIVDGKDDISLNFSRIGE